ncbi:MAG: hypothetical protein HC780_14200 [Leptolyngbyaceae cyanobacterium CSU_1_3]|nr:hypothetical protein [Leptolyngbyaceae cyanobacterium CSU_1_3]
MKRELRRIEETLNHLTASPQRVATANPQASASKGLSFDLQTRQPAKSNSPKPAPSPKHPPEAAPSQVLALSRLEDHPPTPETVTLEVEKTLVQPFTVEHSDTKYSTCPSSSRLLLVATKTAQTLFWLAISCKNFRRQWKRGRLS